MIGLLMRSAILIAAGCLAAASGLAAEDSGETGLVILDVRFSETGTVLGAEIVSEEPTGHGFGDAALKEVRDWVFPTAKPGRYTITIRYRLA